MGEFCPKSCLCDEECSNECHHLDDVVFRTPIEAVFNLVVPKHIQIIGENRTVICRQNGFEIGPTWYIRDEGGHVSAIQFQNPLVTFCGTKERYLRSKQKQMRGRR